MFASFHENHFFKNVLMVFKQDFTAFHLNLCFFSLIKLLFCCACKLQSIPTVNDIEYAVRRNFSDLHEFDAWKIFKSNLPQAITSVEVRDLFYVFIRG